MMLAAKYCLQNDGRCGVPILKANLKLDYLNDGLFDARQIFIPNYLLEFKLLIC